MVLISLKLFFTPKNLFNSILNAVHYKVSVGNSLIYDKNLPMKTTQLFHWRPSYPSSNTRQAEEKPQLPYYVSTYYFLLCFHTFWKAQTNRSWFCDLRYVQNVTLMQGLPMLTLMTFGPGHFLFVGTPYES